MSSTEQTVGALSAEDVSYLRRADDVYAINVGGANYLRVTKRADYRDAFSQDRRVDIPVGGNGADGFFASAWEFPWETLRTGDVVSFYWYPDAHTSENLRAAGLHGDVLYVDITRGKRSARYVAGTSMCPDNSARMCRSGSRVAS